MKVRSFSTKGQYYWTTPTGYCSCPDAKYREHECKHQKLVKSITDYASAWRRRGQITKEVNRVQVN